MKLYFKYKGEEYMYCEEENPTEQIIEWLNKPIKIHKLTNYFNNNVQNS